MSHKKPLDCLVCRGLADEGRLPAETVVGQATGRDSADSWIPCSRCLHRFHSWQKEHGRYITPPDLKLTEGTMEWVAMRALCVQLLVLDHVYLDRTAQLDLVDRGSNLFRYHGVRFRRHKVVMQYAVDEYKSWHSQKGVTVDPDPDSLPRLSRVLKDHLKPLGWMVVRKQGRMALFPVEAFA